MSTAEHRRQSPASVVCGVLTVSDTRTLETDTGGKLLADLLVGHGHSVVVRDIVPDDPTRMTALIEGWLTRGDLQAILLTGGTGITARDQTCETIGALLTKPMPGYGELFRMLSYEEIGPAAMLSRAIGGARNGVIILTMPGSTAAVRLAVEKLIGPELGHLVREATR
ncbi:MAG: MogA/MoaB family molybdenum cofactor biosynthesis protein [Pirellulales bacterium]